MICSPREERSSSPAPGNHPAIGVRNATALSAAIGEGIRAWTRPCRVARPCAEPLGHYWQLLSSQDADPRRRAVPPTLSRSQAPLGGGLRALQQSTKPAQ